MKVKNRSMLLLPFLSGIVLLPLLSGCASTRIEHLSADRFIQKVEQAKQINSASWISYVGCSHDRAYLEYGDTFYSGPEPRTIVYWTELDALPSDLAEQLKHDNLL